MRANKWISRLLCGLCLSVPVITTAWAIPQSQAGAAAGEMTQQGEPPGIVMPPSLPPPRPAAPPATAPAVPAAAEPAPAKPATPTKAERFTLLLPLSSDSLGKAANAVRAGFMAAYEQEQEGVSVKVVMTTDIPEEIVSSYTNSLADSDLVIGPLTRSAAAAIADSGAVRLPTISLTQSDIDSESTTAQAPLMVTMGLSVEDEAREAAAWVLANKAHKLFAVSTSAAWQRRAARAFAAKAHALGTEVEVVELGSTVGFLSALDLETIKKKVQAEKSVAVFAALDAPQAKQLREVIGNEAALYGTGQMNPVTLPERATAERSPELNGVRLLDIPWQLQPDHAAVMIYPRMVVAADQKRSADMERLYALGVDAFRVARQIAAGRKQFEVDGVTGRLKISADKNGSHFERIEPFAVYRDGLAVFLSDGR